MPYEEYRASFYMVGLVDILGQQDSLNKFTAIPASRDDADSPKFVGHIKDTIEKARRFRIVITDLNKNLSGNIQIPKALKANWDNTQETLAEKYFSRDVKVQFFSDLAVLKINLFDNPQNQRFKIMSVVSLFQQLSIAMLTCLAAHIPLRGAIDVGICAELSDNDLYGQAVSRAYDLESKEADYPRILLGNPFMGYLKSFEDILNNNAVAVQEKRIVEQLLKYILEHIEVDSDGKAILSYLSPVVLSSYAQSKDTLNEALIHASDFIQGEIDKHEANKGAKLFCRYKKLKAYFQRHNCWRE